MGTGHDQAAERRIRPGPQAVQDADTERKEQAFALTQEFWKGLTRKQQTDMTAYRDAGRKFLSDRLNQADVPASGWGRYREPDLEKINVIHTAQGLCQPHWGQEKPKRVMKTDVDFPTNRTTRFHLADGSIDLDRETSSVDWTVSENTRAVEDAHADPLAKEFFKAIGQVKWTRGTGGVFTGNDELNQDNRHAGGGANYVTRAYGPIGAQEAPGQCHPYTDSQGRRMTQDALAKLRQEQFQAEMDLQRKLERQAPERHIHRGAAARPQRARRPVHLQAVLRAELPALTETKQPGRAHPAGLFC
ncbi:hypothetical protein D477_011591 [Arthrobacter crystallopoietes BAB-32]|uniref:Uncharacterized protein n=1 Tax=Arthrobacter crystallopoietes BAB-32 TaxID=1246476 RepID=N1V228_9MICC|nr:hypothetical protein [Arthrobacter crystallopoietes]EMY34059.1 hypothetical protein D477_011591 [Arthrobacter crystallopoietes BAB-32]